MRIEHAPASVGRNLSCTSSSRPLELGPKEKSALVKDLVVVVVVETGAISPTISSNERSVASLDSALPNSSASRSVIVPSVPATTGLAGELAMACAALAPGGEEEALLRALLREHDAEEANYELPVDDFL